MRSTRKLNFQLKAATIWRQIFLIWNYLFNQKLQKLQKLPRKWRSIKACKISLQVTQRRPLYVVRCVTQFAHQSNFDSADLADPRTNRTSIIGAFNFWIGKNVAHLAKIKIMNLWKTKSIGPQVVGDKNRSSDLLYQRSSLDLKRSESFGIFLSIWMLQAF